jgi:signal transduction histidine kinase
MRLTVIRTTRIQQITWYSANRWALYRWLTQSLAAVTLAMILAFTLLLWPIPYLGFNADPLTATIVFVEPGSSAEIAGLQVGDQVLRMYDRAWDEVVSVPNMLALIGPPEQPVPIRVERAGAVHTVALPQGTPSIAFQMGKATNLLLIMLCWLTGYILGIVRRHESAGSSLVAWFWLGMSGILGGYFFARFASYPLRLVLDWLMLTVLIPLAVYIHVWFPVRPVTPQQARTVRRALFGSWLLLNSGLAASIFVWSPTLIELVMRLSDLVLIGFVIGLSVSGVILRRAYRRTMIEHVRRQIRLIAMACFFVAIAWLLLLVLPNFLFGETVIADNWIDLLTGAVPLAYLVGGVATDLYRLDRVILRMGVHAGVVTLLAGFFAGVTIVFALQGTLAVLWIAVCFVVMYRPVLQIGFHLVPGFANPAHNTYHALHTAAANLTATLDRSALIEAVGVGVRATFGAPAMAFYAGDVERTNELTCVIQERLLQLPQVIAAGDLTQWLCLLPPVTETRALQNVFAQEQLKQDEAQAFHHPGVVLWCPIRHVEGYLLGVLLLGMRGDLDPYRTEDIRELQRLLAAASLALANSAAYTQQREAETMIRQLYQRLQQTQDTTAAAIARELHDEVINVNIRLNIESLQQVIRQVPDITLRSELELILESERTAAQALRMICEHLHPTGIDDPLGLSAVLRMQVEKMQAVWSGLCQLVVEHTPCPIAAQTQHEALRITREALTNAVKHAAATEIVVQLCYPDTPDDPVCLTIRDNGRTEQLVAARPGHWGVRNMVERARAVGGTLEFCREPEGGTAVVFMFAPTAGSAVFDANVTV